MEDKKNVLVLGCGTLAATDINMALRNNSEFEIYGSSIYKNHGKYVYKKYIEEIPSIQDENFINILNDVIKKYDFKFIIPTHEDMALFLQKNNDLINATIVCSCYETSLLCRYKSKTYKKLEKYEFVPKTYKLEDVKTFPVFVKKDDDQGGRHAYKVENNEELELYTSKNKNMIICEFLPGEEVTIDCFTNKNGELVFCNPRVADRMLAGIDVHSRRKKLNNEISDIAQSINKEIKFRGFWFFQLKKDVNGRYKLLEISTRLPGAFSLSRCLDVNLPLLALKDFDEQEIKSINFNDINIEADKQFFGKYEMNIEYSKILVDLDTCFLLEGKVNGMLIMFLYQCVNKNKQIYGLTTNKEQAKNYLIKNKISEKLFEEIIDMDKNEYIKTLKKSNEYILISNNDIYREYVRNCKGIFCFSNNIVEALIDWRA